MKGFALVAGLLFLLAPKVIFAQATLTITTEPNAIVWIDEIRRVIWRNHIDYLVLIEWLDYHSRQ
jgi:hypothetical protein